MIIHVYCSYRLSPVGFQHGILRYPVSGDGGGFCPLSPPEENAATRFVTTAFNHGFITKAYGKIPGSESYVFLVKGRQYSYPGERKDFGKDVYINLAFEFSDWDKYKRFAASFTRKLKDDEDGLNREMADMIHPDYAVPDYALDIRRENLDAFLSETLGGQSDAQTAEPIENTVFSVLSAQKDCREELTQLFALSASGYALERVPPKQYVYKKKDLPPPGKLPVRLILTVSLILMLILGVFLFLNSQKKDSANQTAVSVQEAETSALPDASKTPESAAPELT